MSSDTELKKREIGFTSTKSIEPKLRLGHNTGQRVNNLLAAKKEYTEEDLLANTLYIFILLTFCTIVAASISFGIREYYLSLKNKSRSAINSSGSWSCNESKDESNLQYSDTKSKEQADEDIFNYKVSKPTAVGLVQEVDDRTHLNKSLMAISGTGSITPTVPISVIDKDSPHTVEEIDLATVTVPGRFKRNSKIQPQEPLPSWNRDEQSGWSTEAESEDSDMRTLIINSTEVEKIELFHEEILSPGFSEVSIADFVSKELNDVKGLSHYKKRTKAVYNFKDLYSIKEQTFGKTLFNGDYTKFKELRMSQLMRYSIPIPKTDFSTAGSAVNTIRDVKAAFMNQKNSQANVDTSSKSVMLLIMLSVGASYRVLDNPNYFLTEFNEFIEYIVDTGTIFEILDDCKSYVQTLLIEMVVIYCWSQWNFKGKNKSHIQEQFQQWRLLEPVVQTRNTIFRFICNLELGMYVVQNKNHGSRLEGEFKIHTLLRETIRTSYCNDYIGFIPMLAQAVDIAKIQSVKYLFYEGLFILIQKHSQCCMAEYLSDPSTELKSLIQHGLWSKHDSKICKRAKDIYNYLLTKNPNVEVWWKEVNGGKIFVPSALLLSTPSTNHNQSDAYTAPQRPVTPGSWNIGNSVEQNKSKSSELNRSSSFRSVQPYTGD